MDEGHDEPKIDCLLHKYLNALWILTVIIIVSLYVGGIFTLLFEEDFTNYSREIEIDNFRRLIDALDRNGLTPVSDEDSNVRRFGMNAINQVLSKMKPSNTNLNNVVPLDQFESFDYTIDIEPSCGRQWGKIRGPNTVRNLITINIAVKSAVSNYARRGAIRQTWYLNRTVDNLVQFKTVFMIGACDERNPVPKSSRIMSPDGTWSAELCRKSIHSEANQYGDIVQISAIDNYYNNTIKTFMTLRWIVERCPSDFTLALDDDFVFEVDNFMEHIKRLISMEGINLGTASDLNGSVTNKRNFQDIHSKQSENFKPEPNQITRETIDARLQLMENFRALSSQYLYTGFMRNYVHPFRVLFSKWYVSRRDYAFNRYPPFITGGSVLMSFKTIKHFYLSSYFTRAFIYDDVYIGMLAYKLGFLPESDEKFMCDIGAYIDADPIRPNSTDCIGVHDIKPDKLLELWKLRKQVQSGDPS